MAIAENSYLQKMGHSCLKILDPKIWLSSEISDPKNGTHTTVCKHGKYPPWSTTLPIKHCKHNHYQGQGQLNIVYINFGSLKNLTCRQTCLTA